MNFKLISKNISLLLFVVLAITVFYLSPTLKCGFFSDDCLNSMVPGLLINGNTDVFSFTFQIISEWIHGGRIYPLAFYVYFLFSLVHNFFVYHLLILNAILIDILLFGYYVKIMTKSAYVSLLSMLIMSVLFQFRIYHDPILSYHMLLQIVFFYLLASLITFTYYLKQSKKTYLIISCFLYILGMLTYEITYLFFPLFFITAYFYEDNNNFLKAVKKSLPYIVIALIFIFISISWRLLINVPVSGGSNSGPYTINTDPVAYVSTLISQSVAALPMSYYLFDPLAIFEHDTVKLLSHINTFLLFTGFLSSICFILTFSGVQKDLLKRDSISRKIEFLGTFGFSLFLLPGLLLSLSPKYQQEITMGVGYLPVFVSYFGVSLMIVALLILMSQTVSRFDNRLFTFVIIVFAFFFSLMVTINYINNSVVVEKQDNSFLYPRALMESGLHNGIFKQVSSGSFLLAQNSYLWDRPEFYTMYGGVKLRGIGLSGYDLYLSTIPVSKTSLENGVYKLDISSNDNVYYLNYASNSLNNGYAVTGQVIRFNATNTTLIDVTSQEAYVYIEDPGYENHNVEDPHFQINGQWANMDTMSGLYPFQIKKGDSQLKLVSSGSGWVLYSLSQENCMIDLKSVSVEQIRNS